MFLHLFSGLLVPNSCVLGHLGCTRAAVTSYYNTTKLAKYQHAEEIQLCIKSNKHRKQLAQLQQDIIMYNPEGLVSDHRASWALKHSRSINRDKKRINKTVT